MEKMYILVLFLILGECFQSVTIKSDDSYKFVSDALYYIEKVSFYS